LNTDYDQPWSPFPVQDWSTLPADPLGGVAVNPTWPAPEAPQRSWWQPLIIFGLVAALVAGAAFVASSVGVAARATAATRYLPSDGAVSYQRTDTTRELKTKIGLAVTESARLSGVAGLLSTDSTFATKMLDEAYADRNTIQILNHNNCDQRSGGQCTDHPFLPSQYRRGADRCEYAVRGLCVQPRPSAVARGRPRREPVE